MPLRSMSACALFLLCGCPSSVDEATPSGLRKSSSSDGGIISGPHLYASNSCIFDGDLRSQNGKSLFVGEVVSALVEPAVNMLFSTVTAALKDAAEPEEVTFSAHINLLVDDPFAETNKFPVCLQFVKGSFFARAADWGLARREEIIKTTFGQNLIRTALGDDGVEDIDEFLTANRIYLANAPDVFVELYLRTPKGMGVIAISPVLVLFAKPSIDGSELAVTIQISDPTSAGKGAAGELQEFSMANVPPGTVALLDAGIIETPWAPFLEPNSVGPRTVKVTVTETRNGNVFLAKLVEILEAASPALKKQVVASLDPKQVAEAKRNAANLKGTVAVELATLRLNADQEIEDWRAIATDPDASAFDKRQRALDALKAVNEANAKARERDVGAVYESNIVTELVEAAEGK